MRIFYTMAASVALLMSTAAMAQDAPASGAGDGHHPHLTQEQKEAIHDCAKKSGVDLPPPSADGPPKLSDDQRKVVRACFDKLGIKPPMPPREGGGPGGQGGPAGQGDHSPAGDTMKQ